MDWMAIGLQVAKIGLPVLGTFLGGPLGGAAGAIVAKALGVEATPEAVNGALQTTDNDVLIQRLKSAEAETAAMVEAQAKVMVAQSADVNTTLRAELTGTGDTPTVWAMFQRGWRPAFGWLLIFECFIFLLLLLHEAFTGDFNTMTALLQHEDFLKWFFGFQFGVVGVFGFGRSQEKVAAINATASTSDANNGGLIGRAIDALRGRS